MLVSVYRQGSDGTLQLVAAAAPVVPGAEFYTAAVDPVPPLGVEVTYLVETITALGGVAQVTGTIEPPACRGGYLNGGAGYATCGVLLEGLNVTASPDRPKALVQFEGRDLPVEFAGQAKVNTLRVQGTVATFDGNAYATEAGYWGPFADLMLVDGPLIWRDLFGRRWLVSVSDPSVTTDAADGLATQVGFTVTQVDANE